MTRPTLRATTAEGKKSDFKAVMRETFTWAPWAAGTHARARRHAMGVFGPEATSEGPASPRSGSPSAGWATSLTFAGRASRPSGSSLSEQHLPIDCGMDAAKPSANSKPSATPRPAATSTATGSKRETSDEISGRQTLHRHRWSQNQRQPRGCVLEGAQGDRQRARRDLVGPRRRDRFRAATRQPVFGDSLVRARFLSQPAVRP